MDLTLPAEEQELVDTLDALLTKKSSPAHVRDAESLGFDPDLWRALVDLGVPGLASASLAGHDAVADLRQLTLIAELVGRHLASAPVVETLVAVRLLERCGAAGADLARRAAAGTVITVDLHAREAGPAGTSRLLPAGAIAEVIITLRDGVLIAVANAAPMVAAPNLGSLPLADRALTGESVELARGVTATAHHAQARREWQLLTAAQLVGLSARALEIGVDYVRHRVIFDQAVGSFQTVAHRLADDATAVDGARLLVQQAAWAADTHRASAPSTAVMAFCFAAEQAVQISGDCLHYHGGYGFTLEYDIQLFYRRARALPLVLGSVRREYQTLADHLFDGEPIDRDAAGRDPGPERAPSFDLGPDVATFRAEVGAFLDEHLTPDVRRRVRETGSMHNWDVHRALGAKGWIAASWPVELGGQGRNPLEMMAMREEMKKRHAPTEGLGMTMLVARAVREFGSPELRRDIVARAIAGEILMCLGYSEPHGGSDVASARTSAVRDGDDWVINGQKVFTTLAEEADYVFLLTRTTPWSAANPVAKHRGLTMFLVPMDAPGVQVDAIRTLGGERTNQTFYADVRIPDALRVGEVNGGWAVLMAALAYERSGVGEDARIYRKAVAAARAAGSITDPGVREQLARVALDTEVITLLGRRSCWIESVGGVPTVEGSMYKLYSAESRVRNSKTLLDLLGPEGLRELGDPEAPAGGDLVEEFRHAVILPIYGGASEVQRKILAERHLGLPR